ncbi:glutamate receptor 3-like [Condylostylus longicornis]|uniref:glutamate receptor 3-like n=1 Tax=Condylostylus longicornis TaxID=2530218 RepID=UPI00244DD9E0|nr:glutamate receptor 3-like [Condylostylus longicornis]
MTLEILNRAKDYGVIKGTEILLTNFNIRKEDIPKQFILPTEVNINAFKFGVNENLVQLQKHQTLKSKILFDAVWLLGSALLHLEKSNEFNSTEPRSFCNMDEDNSEAIPWNFGEKLLETMKNIPVKEKNQIFSTKDIKFDDTGERIGFVVEIYELKTQVKVATWNSDGIVDFHKNNEKEFSIGKPHFRIVSRLTAPYLTEKIAESGDVLYGNERYEGFLCDLIYVLSKQMKFNYSIYIASDNYYGSFDFKRNEWNGIIGEIVDGKADIGMADLTVTSKRYEAIDFTIPYMQLGISALIYNDPQPVPKLFSFLQPFNLEVWYFMIAAYLATLTILILLIRIAISRYEDFLKSNSNSIWKVRDVAWVTIKSFMIQKTNCLPR